MEIESHPSDVCLSELVALLVALSANREFILV